MKLTKETGFFVIARSVIMSAKNGDDHDNDLAQPEMFEIARST